MTARLTTFFFENVRTCFITFTASGSAAGQVRVGRRREPIEEDCRYE